MFTTSSGTYDIIAKPTLEGCGEGEGSSLHVFLRSLILPNIYRSMGCIHIQMLIVRKKYIYFF